jgi:hypothetical protein
MKYHFRRSAIEGFCERCSDTKTFFPDAELVFIEYYNYEMDFKVPFVRSLCKSCHKMQVLTVTIPYDEISDLLTVARIADA